jgi:hypothetical protein
MLRRGWRYRAAFVVLILVDGCHSAGPTIDHGADLDVGLGEGGNDGPTDLTGIKPDARDGAIVPSDPSADCVDFNPLRRAYFGDLHVHTAYSYDAYLTDVRNLPEDAYAFAKGKPIGLAPLDALGLPTRTDQLDRPLDFAAVTDHSEFIGEVEICTNADIEGYASASCLAFRAGGLMAVATFGYPAIQKDPQRLPFCGANGSHCLEVAGKIWQRIIGAAQGAYDRCHFTSLIAYEWSASPNLANLHRNVIFNGAAVPALPISTIEEPTPLGLWSALKKACKQGIPGCDVLTIPHNSNLSFGLMFAPTASDGGALSVAEASLRGEMEPLAEIFQHKGDSECAPGLGSPDEHCSFEKSSEPVDSKYRYSYVREALKEGLVQQALLGTNPFKLGMVGSTDTHNASAGSTEEDDYRGHAGSADDKLADKFSEGGILSVAGTVGNPGGLTVVWSEANTREAIFSALKRRETYATSGTRPVVRFFGGWKFAPVSCGAADLAQLGYQQGVAMGGDLPPLPAAGPAAIKGPTFLVSAMRDPGTSNKLGTPLQRIQIVKGWISAGEKKEAVYDVAGDPQNGGSVLLPSCKPQGKGFDSLCTVWTDPDFDPTQPAFYYARVLENPSCRWHVIACQAEGVNCSQPSTIPDSLKKCCDGSLPTTIQERAWTSPIWYTP